MRSGGATSLVLKDPLKVKIMKKRTLKVKLWIVPLLAEGNVVKEPVVQPTKTEIEEFLNARFACQVNADIDCDRTKVSPLAFDTADGTSSGAPAEALESGNRCLDHLSH